MEDKHFPIEGITKESQPFCAILRHISSMVSNEENRNRVYRELSTEYNRSLERGDFEISVICLMIMRLILLEEDNPEHASTLTKISVSILHELEKERPRFFDNND